MTIQRELLDPHGPFETLQALQAALEAWRGEYNGNRPHQSLAMAFPAARFIPAQSPLGLQIPGQLIASASSPACAPADPPTPEPAPASPPPGPDPASQAGAAIEADRVVPPSGNLWIGGQQIWLGAALAGRKITIWADERTVHVLLDRTRIKTLPSRLGITELARLAASGARLAGPSPLPAGGGTAIEVDRLVNATGLASLAGRRFSVGYELAGQQITLRMDSTQMAILGHAGTLLRTMPCPVPPAARPRLRGARRASPIVPRPAGPVTVQRRVSSRGSIMVATQKIQAGPFIAVWRSVRAGGDTKTKKSRRTLALPQRCVDVLREHQMRQDQIRQAAGTRWKENGLVFPSRVGTPADASHVRRSFRKVVAAAGLTPGEWTPRELRHSFVSLLSDAGVPIERISRLVGHSGTSTTETIYQKQIRPVITHGADVMDRIFPGEAAPDA